MDNNHLQAAQEFWQNKKPRDESVLVPFIPAMRFLLEKNCSIKAVHEFVLSRNIQCSYSTVLQFVNRYLASPELRKKNRVSVLVDAESAASRGERKQKYKLSEVPSTASDPIDRMPPAAKSQRASGK